MLRTTTGSLFENIKCTPEIAAKLIEGQHKMSYQSFMSELKILFWGVSLHPCLSTESIFLEYQVFTALFL